MGDYTKFIVNCEVKDLTVDEVKLKIEEMGPSTSAYHCGGEVVQVEKDSFSDRVCVSIICQGKYSRGQQEFMDWLRPFVVDGMGTEGIWAIQIWERGKPKYHTLVPRTEEQIKDEY